MLTFQKSRLAAAIIVATFGLTACGGGSSNSTPEPQPTPTPTNSAPTDISLSSSTVMENQAGAEVGTLSATDPDSGESFSYAVSDARFVVDGDTLKLTDNAELDFEAQQNVDVEVTVTDSGNATFTKTLTLSVEDELDYYGFESQIMPGESAISYSGQTARHLLINDLNILIGSEFGDVNSFRGDIFQTRQDVIDALNSYFDVTDYAALSQRALLTTTTPAAKQTTLAEVSGSSKNLVGKIAGNDAVGQHKNWNDGDFVGWGTPGSTSPEGLVRNLFAMLADNAEAQMQGNTRQTPFGEDITTIYLTEDGRDLKQLIQKFLLMSVAYSQGADDYLDDDTQGKGLLSDHTDTSKPYTPLEHQFDEGFGYFGAARNYLDYSDDEIAGKGGRADWQGYHDFKGDEDLANFSADGQIDFESEYNFGQSVNAAKRDRGATVETDFTAEAMHAFLQGRQLLNNSAGVALTEAQFTELQGYRDTALRAWENAIAATVVHYINDTIADLQQIGSDDFSYSDLAKHWSEMKGFALGLQFNRRSPLMQDGTSFAELHQLMGDQPVLTDSTAVAAYIQDLLAARQLMADSYGFNSDNVTDW